MLHKMNVYVALGCCFLPFIGGFLLLICVFKKNVSIALIASLLGLAAVLPISFLQFLLADYLCAAGTTGLSLFWRTLAFNGIAEEGLKALLLAAIPVKHLKIQLFFAAAALSGLCLGCFESAVYLLRHLQEANSCGAELLYRLIFLRIFSSDALHAFCAGLGGLFVFGCKTKRIDAAALIAAMLMHGLYDFFVSFGYPISLFSIAAILFAAVQCRIGYRKLNRFA